MSISSIDFLSPKITLYHNGRDSHISKFGGILSFLYLILIILLVINFIYRILHPEFYSIYIYDQNVNNTKYIQNIDYLGINHFIQMYSHSNSGWFGDFDNKTIVIYGIKQTTKNIYLNDNESKVDLYNTEHWIYDKCENIKEINENLFFEISQTIANFTKSVCLRYYYNPIKKKYYEIGYEGYISPYLETSLVDEKRYSFKIAIEKCSNNSIFTNKMNYVCHNENTIENYLTLYSDIFIYFSNNQVVLRNNRSPFEKYFYSISSGIQKKSYFENNIIFSPIKFITDQRFFYSKKENLTFILKDHYYNDKLVNEENTLIGVFNFYLRNNLIIYHKAFVPFIDSVSHLGGITQLLFFIFQMFNYLNNNYKTLENTKSLFRIYTGIDSNYFEGNEIFFDKSRHLSSQNYKIKVFNNNNIINNEEQNKKLLKHPNHSKKKMKLINAEHSGAGLYPNKPSKKNLNLILPIPQNNSSRKKNNNFNNKRSQTKCTSTFQMGKQFTIRKKRKSYMSQGYLMKKTDYSSYSKNQSICDNENNNENTSNKNINDINNINNSSFLLLKEREPRERITKYDSKNINDSNVQRRIMKKKMNIKKHQFENADSGQQSITKRIDNIRNFRGRHLSVNFGNQIDNLLSINLIGYKNMFKGKNPSEFINDSSKQVRPKYNYLPIFYNNKFQTEKSQNDDNVSKPSIINNNDNNVNIIFDNPQNTETASYLKNIIHNKIKIIMPDNKQDAHLNIFLEKKTKILEFVKFVLSCFKNKENKIYFLYQFRKKLLSEEHLYKVHINLYLLEKIFQIDEAYKIDANELYNNL